MKLLIVEDEAKLADYLRKGLSEEGYVIDVAANGIDGLHMASHGHYDLIALDTMLPGIDGFEVCRQLRKEYSFPIMMLTARTEEIDKVLGLELGADDYLTKPFSMRELLARVKALLRSVGLIQEALNNQAEQKPKPEAKKVELTLTFGNLEIDQSRRELRLGGRPVHVKPKEFDLLLLLARHPGIALSRDLILERVWGWAYDGNSRTVDVHVRWLREKIEEDPGNASRILTVRGIGYRFDG